jgi:uncharacterized protein (TIGR00369 family)
MEAVAEAERRLTVEWQDPRTGLGRARDLDGLAFLEAMIRGELAPAPMAQLLGFELSEVGPGRAAFTVVPGERHYNPMASVHGGLLATLCDSAMGCAVLSTCAAGQLFTTLELKLNFVRPAFAESGLIRCAATVLHRGGRIATADARATDAAGTLYAHATSTCMILEAKR